MIKKLLYLTYISLEHAPASGSSVRPRKMKEALESLGAEVKTFGGINNNILLRRKTVAGIRDLLKNWQPDACYIEPPSGPMFYYGDVRLIKILHKRGVPVSIFYRDAYWKYQEYSTERRLTVAGYLKRLIIRHMQAYQWNVFRKNINLIYFPSLTMAEEFDCPCKDVLPPGSFVPEAVLQKELSDPLQFIFVGGATRNYGIFLTIEAFEKLNRSGIRARLYCICPQDQWNSLGLDKEKYKGWLEVIHTSGDENLKTYYEKSDVALLTAPRTFYRDFAVPVKIFEYISYLKPVLVTNCIETARVVKENGIGWVTEDHAVSVTRKLQELCDNPQEILKVRDHMREARSSNLWISRAEKVIRDLENLNKVK